MKRIFLLVAFVVLFADIADAQSFYAMRRPRSLILVGGIGSSTYFGDMANSGHVMDAKPTMSVGLQYYLSRRISVRTDFTWFQLAGSDAESGSADRATRNLSFYSNNFEMSAVGLINLYPHGRTFYQRPAFNVYGFAGIGVCYFNPKADYQGTSYSLADLKTELIDYNTVTMVIPMGLGVRFRIGPFMNLSFEGGYRKTFSDYMDDVSTVHNDASKFSDPIAAALSDRRPEIGLAPMPDGYIRGNPSSDDAYVLYTVKFEYYLPGNFLHRSGGPKSVKQNRKAFYRYNKRGGLKK